jgi:2-oxoisovalerate dehydrogenase E1 component
VYLSLRAARRLAEAGIECRVVDLRWLAPLPVDDLVAHAREISRVLIVDETRRSGGVSEGIVTALVDAGLTVPVRRLAAHDSFVPLVDAANLVLVSEDDIVTAAMEPSA